MGTIITILILLGMCIFTYCAFVLASHKEEIWEHIEFEEDEKSNSCK